MTVKIKQKKHDISHVPFYRIELHIGTIVQYGTEWNIFLPLVINSLLEPN